MAYDLLVFDAKNPETNEQITKKAKTEHTETIVPCMAAVQAKHIPKFIDSQQRMLDSLLDYPGGRVRPHFYVLG